MKYLALLLVLFTAGCEFRTEFNEGECLVRAKSGSVLKVRVVLEHSYVASNLSKKIDKMLPMQRISLLSREEEFYKIDCPHSGVVNAAATLAVNEEYKQFKKHYDKDALLPHMFEEEK